MLAPQYFTKMFFSRKAPPLWVSCRPFCSPIRRSSSLVATAQQRISESSAKKGRKGPPKGKIKDPKDPNKVVSRTALINFRPRGHEQTRASDKST